MVVVPTARVDLVAPEDLAVPVVPVAREVDAVQVVTAALVVDEVEIREPSTNDEG